MEIYPFITYFRHLMIGKASPEELKNQLDRDLNELKLHTERIKYLEEIIKLWRSRDLETMRRGEIPEFLHYIEFKYEIERNAKDTIKNWSSLFNDLKGKYITDVTIEDFNELMTFKRLPNSTRKITWIGSKADAFRFLDNFNFTLSQFNESFVQKDGKRIDLHDRSETAPKKVFNDLLIRHKQQ